MPTYKSTNPYNGETTRTFVTSSTKAIQSDLDAAHAAFLEWRKEDPAVRSKFIARVAELHRERVDELAAIVTREMGKPIAQAKFEINLAADIYDYYAERGPEFLADEPLNVGSGGKAVVRKEALGVLLGIMPWNFPYYQVARFAGPNLMLGNTILLKHSENCPQTALAIQEIFVDSGLPAAAYRNIFATHEHVASLIAEPKIQGVSLTGSERAGAAVGALAGRNMKKYVLELGGSDSFIVLDSNDLDATVEAAVLGRFLNAGQACNSAKRFIVVEELYEEFVAKFVQRVSSLQLADPMLEDTFIGPVSSRAAAETLVQQVDDAVKLGAVLHTGGTLVQGPGAFVTPAVLTGVTPEMRAYSEELFGPAAVVYRVANTHEAVKLANSSPYGLGAAVFSSDLEKAESVAAELEVGMVTFNSISGSEPDLPFGGIKRSGVGRELAHLGMDEFVNKKLIRIP